MFQNELTLAEGLRPNQIALAVLIALLYGLVVLLGFPSMATTSELSFNAPRFEQVIVADHLRDAYWIDALDMNRDSKPDLVGYGLTTGEVIWYENPTWEKHNVTKLAAPVAMAPYDIDADGWTDIVITHDYGSCAYNCKPEDGKISWLKNPGNSNSDWEQHFIGNLVSAHRVQLGYFTQPDRLELLALPIVGTNGFHSPAQVTVYKKPDNVSAAEGWDATLVDGSSFHVLHGVSNRSTLSDCNSSRNSVLLASEEGISSMCFGNDNIWHREHIAAGELGQAGRTGFRGSGDVDVAQIGGKPYITAIEPFHGNTVAVYGKAASDTSWSRTVLDVFGDPNEVGEGAGHHVLASNFDEDADDEFLVALRGPMPWQGVFYYKAVNAEQGLFVKTKVSSSSASRMVLDDFNQDGRLDFATIGYAVPGYFIADNPQILVFLNQS